MCLDEDQTGSWPSTDENRYTAFPQCLLVSRIGDSALTDMAGHMVYIQIADQPVRALLGHAPNK
jgi:hypothetical protein